MELLRLATAGSVDDGKSTLIGRLLFDTDSIYDDQIAALEIASERRGGAVDLALLTDGLKAEREQGITIDVAYRYFSTARRKFILADCPGHIQYTRNMVTGMSNANVGILMLDARHGLVEQTRRHCFIAALLRVPHIVLCINKMDLVDYSQEVFNRIRAEFEVFSRKLDIADIEFIPVSALKGDNVVERSGKMPWYNGRSVLEHLEDLHLASDENFVDFRFMLQLPIRARSSKGAAVDYRGYAGRILSGEIKVGDAVVALPSGVESRVKQIEMSQKSVSSAPPSASVILHFEDEIDLSRGDMLVRPHNRPVASKEIEAIICWMGDEALDPTKRYFLRHASSEVSCLVKEVVYKFDISNISRNFSDKTVSLNDIARVKILSSQPLFLDSYKQNKATGSFVLVDSHSFQTVAGGIVNASYQESLEA